MINNKNKKNDEIYTREEEVYIIANFLKPNSVIWCPADKEESNFVKVLNKLGHQVFYTHIENGEDFLEYTPSFEFDYIITNPPYSIKGQWFKKCLEHNKPFALLMPTIITQWVSYINVADSIEILHLNRVKWTNYKTSMIVGYVCKDVLPSKSMTRHI